jgi:CheY-like chemotaxis protein
VYGIVKQNNGQINVYSEPGIGTTFKIYLPRYESQATQPQKEDEKSMPKGRGETVLIVEDEESIIKISKNMLDKLGYIVLTANTPREAIRLAETRACRIDLLLTDVIMSEMNGRELAGRLAAIYPHTKLLYMSGYTADVIGRHGVLDAGVHFIQKPFSLKAIAIKVREALGE